MPGHGSFYWNEPMARDAEGANKFFAETVGWTFDGMPMPEGTYWVARLEGHEAPLAGIMDMSGVVPDGVPPHWMSYLEVDDVDARVAKVVSAGGKIIREPFDVPGVGRIAILKDATGAAMGWMTPSSSAGC